MRSGRFTTLIICIAAVCAAISCKKDEEDTTLPSLTGYPAFSIPEYILPNSTHTMVSTGVTHPDGEIMGCYWKVSPDMEASDTTARYGEEGGKYEFSFNFGEELQTHTVTCTYYATGYYSTSSSKTTVTVKGGVDGSLTGTGITPLSDTLVTDRRDGKKYYITVAGQREWFRQNLAYEGEIKDGDAVISGVPFRNAEAMSDVLGLFYTHKAALKACPEGWRVPFEEDWASLAKVVASRDRLQGDFQFISGKDFKGVAGGLMADTYFNGTKMWEFWPSVKITNSSRLGAAPAGYADYPSTFIGVNEYAAFWSQDAVDGQGLYRYIYVDDPDFRVAAAGDSFGANVRCVRNLSDGSDWTTTAGFPIN
ncbi:MAG: FISUMP domain-containing protein [Candidatus Cryptobacteroides sp.]